MGLQEEHWELLYPWPSRCPEHGGQKLQDCSEERHQGLDVVSEPWVAETLATTIGMPKTVDISTYLVKDSRL